MKQKTEKKNNIWNFLNINKTRNTQHSNLLAHTEQYNLISLYSNVKNWKRNIYECKDSVRLYFAPKLSYVYHLGFPPPLLLWLNIFPPHFFSFLKLTMPTNIFCKFRPHDTRWSAHEPFNQLNDKLFSWSEFNFEHIRYIHSIFNQREREGSFFTRTTSDIIYKYHYLCCTYIQSFRTNAQINQFGLLLLGVTWPNIPWIHSIATDKTFFFFFSFIDYVLICILNRNLFYWNSFQSQLDREYILYTQITSFRMLC